MTKLTRGLERLTTLDPVADRLQTLIRSVLPGPVRDLLHGVWLGHPLHPAMVHAPIGAWVSAAVLDALPGRERAATTLVAFGTASALPAAAAGANDWASLSRRERRVGLVHAAANTVALTLYGASLAARLRGRQRSGRRLGYAGLAVAGASAYLGGHLSYAQAAGVNQAAPRLRLIPDGWHDLGDVSEFPQGPLTVRELGEISVLVHRSGDRFSVMIERCAHQGGPLSEGDVVAVRGEDCVVCPLHGSMFRLSDGAVRHGPAATDQPTLRTRIVDGRLQAGDL